MFAAWGSWVARFRWPVLVLTVAAVAAAGVWGLGVFGQLSEGGYNDPGSESTRAANVVRDELGAQGGDVVVIYTPTSGGIDDAVLGQRIENTLGALPGSAVTAVASYWPDKVAQYKSADGSSAVAVLTLAGEDDGEKLESYREIDDKLAVEGATVQAAGGAPLGDASATRSTQDLAFAEAISLPIVLVLLLFIFGSLVAASLPVLVGGCAVLGSLGVLHAVAYTHDVNSFAVNVASLLGLGMAIDYGLFMVGRFREEQGFGRTPAQAVTRTVATAGRTVVFSATLLMIALAGLLLFPQGFLKSLAYGGLAAVALAAILSLTLLPALLAVLGPRVDKLPVRLPRRKNAAAPGTGWSRLAGAVLRRPVLVALPILAGLLVLAAPIRGVEFGENDERILPAGDSARMAIEALKSDFPALSSAGIQVVLRGTKGEPPPAAVGKAFTDAAKKVPGIAAVTPAGTGGDAVVLTATLAGKDPFSPVARDAVDALRALPVTGDTEVLVGGATARNVDSLTATADRLPLMVSLLVGATLILMFLAFGSVLLPIKAVVMSALSLSATFGILVWIFQDGHGADLLQVTPAPLEVGIVVLMAAVVFGLSTDYEVFLLSRMVEARTRGASTAEAVTTGLARTGRVISAAAVLLIVVTGAFALSSVTTMRFVGVGMIIALFLDATVVRMLLVPAVLKLMGEAAWWSPGPLRRLQQKAGLAEYEDEELFPTVSVGRHAAPESAAAPARTSSASAPRHASRAETGPGALPAPPPSAAYAGESFGAAASPFAGDDPDSTGPVSFAGSSPSFSEDAPDTTVPLSERGSGSPDQPFAGASPDETRSGTAAEWAGDNPSETVTGTGSAAEGHDAPDTSAFGGVTPVSPSATGSAPVSPAAAGFGSGAGSSPVSRSATGSAPVSPSATGSAPVSGSAYGPGPIAGRGHGLPVAGSRPHPAPSKITLDESPASTSGGWPTSSASRSDETPADEAGSAAQSSGPPFVTGHASGGASSSDAFAGSSEAAAGRTTNRPSGEPPTTPAAGAPDAGPFTAPESADRTSGTSPAGSDSSGGRSPAGYPTGSASPSRPHDRPGSGTPAGSPSARDRQAAGPAAGSPGGSSVAPSMWPPTGVATRATGPSPTAASTGPGTPGTGVRGAADSENSAVTASAPGWPATPGSASDDPPTLTGWPDATDTGERSQAGPTGNSPGADPGDSRSVVDPMDTRPTANLADHLTGSGAQGRPGDPPADSAAAGKTDEEPGPETTAVLELRPTVDLADRRDQQA
ncbi:MMPL family transporter [Actinoplanes friuliensis]|uniref:MMPL family transporter n=1 Tax=Actinoplanes friuliensis TaxID=196914 RepID=UPI000416D385|nr:MMPL family transporter [Actinoplanes friuliensis]